MRSRHVTTSFALLGLAACACGAPSTPAPVSPTPPVATTVTPSFEVHEWGLIRGTTDDHVMISGPHAPEPAIVMTKPVLYFHRGAVSADEGALVVDVDVEIPEGSVVESWPSMGGAPSPRVAWHGVVVQDGSCHGSHYPTAGEEPCSRLTDGCEAATLAGVETLDSDCLFWPPPPDDDGPTQSWNHLFYRAERMTEPTLPLRFEPLPDGTLRVTTTGTDPVPGRLIRLRRGNGVGGVVDGVTVGAPPAPGATEVLAAPSAPLTEGAEALASSLREAGLTDDEIAAFRSAWDATLFGPNVVATTAPSSRSVAIATTTPVMLAPPAVTTSVIYVLPISSADALATLRITPAPAVLRRAIVIWLDESA